MIDRLTVPVYSIILSTRESSPLLTPPGRPASFPVLSIPPPFPPLSPSSVQMDTDPHCPHRPHCPHCPHCTTARTALTLCHLVSPCVICVSSVTGAVPGRKAASSVDPWPEVRELHSKNTNHSHSHSVCVARPTCTLYHITLKYAL